MICAREGETWKAKQSSSCVRDGLKYQAKPQSAPCSCLCLLVFPLPEVCGRPQERSASEQEGCAPQAPLFHAASLGCCLGFFLQLCFAVSPLLTVPLPLLYLPHSHPCCYPFEGHLLAGELPRAMLCVTALLPLPQLSRAAFLFLAWLLTTVAEERNRPEYGLCRRCSAAPTVYRLCASENVSIRNARLHRGLRERPGSCAPSVLQPLALVIFCMLTAQRRFRALCRSKGLGFFSAIETGRKSRRK